jgi:hypothetical protein
MGDSLADHKAVDFFSLEFIFHGACDLATDKTDALSFFLIKGSQVGSMPACFEHDPP